MGERWAAVEIMGHRQHVGPIREVSEFGATFIQIEALQQDGDFQSIRYGGSAIFSMRDVTEEAARLLVLPPWPMGPCGRHREPSARPGACAMCGRTSEEHAAALALPEHDDPEQCSSCGEWITVAPTADCRSRYLHDGEEVSHAG